MGTSEKPPWGCSSCPQLIRVSGAGPINCQGQARRRLPGNSTTAPPSSEALPGCLVQRRLHCAELELSLTSDTLTRDAMTSPWGGWGVWFLQTVSPRRQSPCLSACVCVCVYARICVCVSVRVCVCERARLASANEDKTPQASQGA